MLPEGKLRQREMISMVEGFHKLCCLLPSAKPWKSSLKREHKGLCCLLLAPSGPGGVSGHGWSAAGSPAAQELACATGEACDVMLPGQPAGSRQDLGRGRDVTSDNLDLTAQ